MQSVSKLKKWVEILCELSFDMSCFQGKKTIMLTFAICYTALDKGLFQPKNTGIDIFLTLVMLSKLRCHTHFQLSVSQIT